MIRIAPYLFGGILLLLPGGLAVSWVKAAGSRLVAAESQLGQQPQQVAVAAPADEKYCTPELKKILRRVLQSCGLVQGRSGRGCKPMDAKSVATMSGEDFNALFLPMKDRGGIIQFEKGSADLEAVDQALVEKIYAGRRGASYFFVVSRASPEGSVSVNRKLSRERAEAVMKHLQDKFNDTELDQLVGLLWLGEEYAQLDPSFCDWTRSGAAEGCSAEDLNRSAFITWIDCRL
jgi:outer membrane protein OmpA-like peptidoglycan-associated protein